MLKGIVPPLKAARLEGLRCEAIVYTSLENEHTATKLEWLNKAIDGS